MSPKWRHYADFLIKAILLDSLKNSLAKPQKGTKNRGKQRTPPKSSNSAKNRSTNAISDSAKVINFTLVKEVVLPNPHRLVCFCKRQFFY